MSEVRSHVNARLRDYFEEKQREVQRVCPESAKLAQSVTELTMRGGKRLRAAVVYAGFRAAEPRGEMTTITPVAAAIELLQSYFLIHDDWMDNDDERRGGPSVHVALGRHYQDVHLGDSVAILAGDLASAYAAELMHEASFPATHQKEAHLAYVQMQKEVFMGQHLDLVHAKDIARMHRLKTGSYTVHGPITLGALLGGASPDQLAALERFAEPLGLAFQLRDDWLGTFGDPAVTGKPVGNDLREGKHNAVTSEALQSLSGEAKVRFEKVMGLTQVDDAEVHHVIELLDRHGVKARIEGRLEEYVYNANQAITQTNIPNDVQPLLVDVLAMMTQRRH